MKIGQTPEKQVGASPPAPAPAGKNAPSPAATAQASAKSAGVAVTVSTQARSLEKVGRPDSDGDVDTAKVEAVRSAIEQGTYLVNPEAIADKLLGNAQEMFNRTQN
jgi:negative regulator of flagellin synthesis FlgM